MWTSIGSSKGLKACISGVLVDIIMRPVDCLCGALLQEDRHISQRRNLINTRVMASGAEPNIHVSRHVSSTVVIPVATVLEAHIEKN
jgi:hypothetical protein